MNEISDVGNGMKSQQMSHTYALSVLLTQEKKHCIASRAVALDIACVVGVFYITTLVAYKINLGCMWE